jgi:protein SCO1
VNAKLSASPIKTTHAACKDCAEACAACVDECRKVTEKSARAPFLNRHFRLTTHKGQVWTSANCMGQPTAVFFGYTGCPSICPTALLQVSNVLARLGPAADRLSVLFVTVDPERDNPERLGQFLSSFDTRIVGLTGEPSEVRGLAEAFGAYFAKSSAGIDHSTALYVLDRNGYLTDELPYHLAEAEEVARLSILL